jgi:glucose uptake protein GlcU
VINPVSIIAIAMLIFLLGVMYFTHYADRITPPASLVDALKRNLTNLLAWSLGVALVQVYEFGLNIVEWKIPYFVGAICVVTAFFIFDLIILKRHNSAESE